MKKLIVLILAMTLVLTVISSASAWRDPTSTEKSNAVAWAKSKLGNTGYDGYCLGFVNDAYRLGASVTPNQNPVSAKDAALNWYTPSGTMAAAPYGSFVFWTGPSSYGHVGIVSSDVYDKMVNALSTVREEAINSYYPTYFVGWDWVQIKDW